MLSANTSPVDQVFAEELLATLTRRFKDLDVEVEKSTEDALEVVVEFSAPYARFVITVRTVNSSPGELEADPRQFGDTAEVTARAMQDWSPGKTNAWTTEERTVEISSSGFGLDHTVRFRYDKAGRIVTKTEGVVEKIIDLIRQRISQQEIERRQEKEDLRIRAIKEAFQKL